MFTEISEFLLSIMQGVLKPYYRRRLEVFKIGRGGGPRTSNIFQESYLYIYLSIFDRTQNTTEPGLQGLKFTDESEIFISSYYAGCPLNMLHIVYFYSLLLLLLYRLFLSTKIIEFSLSSKYTKSLC